MKPTISSGSAYEWFLSQQPLPHETDDYVISESLHWIDLVYPKKLPDHFEVLIPSNLKIGLPRLILCFQAIDGIVSIQSVTVFLATLPSTCFMFVLHLHSNN
ncbi:MAG: hypothetical protein AAGH89_14830 [Verrucomicrobiota bacterium]